MEQRASLDTASLHPGVFGHVPLESPAPRCDGRLARYAEEAKELREKMYVAMGTKETKDRGQECSS